MKIVITYKKVSCLNMRVTQKGEVHVSAPIGYPRSEIEKFIETNKEWIVKAIERTQKRLDTRHSFYVQLPLKTKEQKEEAFERIKAKTIPLLEKYSSLMGVSYSGVTYKNTISKWGSCNTCTKHINLSVYLLLLPDFCIEHVVVHELAHLLVPNHGPKFHATMDIFFPRWKEARAETLKIARNG